MTQELNRRGKPHFYNLIWPFFYGRKEKRINNLYSLFNIQIKKDIFIKKK